MDSRATSVVAGAALVILTIAYGAPLLSAVALKPIAAEFGTERGWMLAGRQKRFARYGAGAAALGHASALALPNETHVALLAMAAVLVAAVTSSTGPAARLFLRRRASNGSSP